MNCSSTNSDTQKDSHNSAPSLAMFLADQCDATKERYAKTLASVGDDFGPADDFRYAESLVYFGLLERQATPIMRGKHVCGSRTWFKKAAESTPTVNVSGPLQTEFAI